MKLAMLAVEDKLAQAGEQLADGDGQPLGWQVVQIHDSIMVECPRTHAEQVGRILRETMENIYPQLGVKLKVDVSIGENWGQV